MIKSSTSFFGCLATTVVMVEYITPPDLPLMDPGTWVKLGLILGGNGGGLVGLVRANQGQSTNIERFVLVWSQTQLQIVQMTTPSQLCLSDAIVIWP